MATSIRTPVASLASLPSLELLPSQLPRHIAIIMDGNGRWAKQRGLPRIFGHREGVQSVRTIVEESCRIGLEQLTLYCFSSENWKRPLRETQYLMRLLRHFLVSERKELIEHDIKIKMIGSRSGMPDDVLSEYDKTEAMTSSNTGLTLCLAVNYGGRAEIAEAARKVARDVEDGLINPDGIDESTFGRYLSTADMPDPDLLIRTAGEYRLSNYMLWQLSYAEFWVTPVHWPDFRVTEFHAALRDFARRHRRFGGLPRESVTAVPNPTPAS